MPNVLYACFVAHLREIFNDIFNFETDRNYVSAKNNKSQLFVERERERKGVPFAPSTSQTVLHAPHVATS